MWQNLFIALGSISGCIGLLMLMQVGWSFYSSFKTGVMSAAAAATAGLPLGLTSIINPKKTNNNSNTAENDPKDPSPSAKNSSTPAKNSSTPAKNSSTPAENDPKEPSPSAQTGGGGRKSLQAIAEEILVQRKTDEMPTESLVFIGILVAVALGGITYAVFKYQKQSKVKKEDEDASDTDGV
jgi:cobalamin biosynthesis Mg chelatase CobN